MDPSVYMVIYYMWLRQPVWHYARHLWLMKFKRNWPHSLVSAELLNLFWNGGLVLITLPFLSYLFTCSIPGGRFKCHGQDCKMRSVLEVTVIASRKSCDIFGLENESWLWAQAEMVNVQQMKYLEAAKMSKIFVIDNLNY